ncbi:MAG: glycosyltransferase family 9 protein [Alphaproteobacteria bacterium]|nr:glycosyltransferase family 9 protein [Alphaproteobacteria bacterium]
MERVLFITSTRIGDAVINSGILNHLVETRPNARFIIACGPLAEPLFRALPRLDEIIVMAKKKRGGHWIDLWTRTVAKRWDLVVDIRGSATSYVLWTKKRRIHQRSSTPINKVVEASQILRLEKPADPVLWVSDEARNKAAELLPDNETWLAVCPSASAPYKVWPGERFAELVKRLTAQGGPLSGAKIAIFGGPGDKAAAEPLHAALPAEQLLDLTGALDLDTVAAALHRPRVYIGNDSGLMHIAAAAGTPTLGLMGPTDTRLYGPWGDKTAVVRGETSFEEHYARFKDERRFQKESLLLDLSVEAAYEATKTLLERTSR